MDSEGYISGHKALKSTETFGSWQGIEQALKDNPAYNTPFINPNFLSTVANGFGSQLVTLPFETNRFKGVLPLIPLRKRLGIGSANNLPIRYVGPIVNDPAAIPEAVEYLQDRLARKGILEAHYTFPPGIDFDPSNVADPHTEVQDRATCIMPLNNLSKEGVPIQADARMKEKIRKGFRMLEISEATEKEITDELPTLLKGAYERNGESSPYPNHLFEVFWREFNDDPNTTMLSARRDGKTIGTLVAINDGSSAYSSWYSRSYDEAHRNLPILETLVAKMAQNAQQRGLTSYDLGGGTDGIIEFKRRMGASTGTYKYVHTVHPTARIIRGLQSKINTLRK